ncbi:TenA family transcriptional regulator [Noviherbaspirillum massiliense]|uniref:TenA family transcriptional regulator n=1 Tax=Noviherbaspirillum massiliense TaxID=1465823 RepID=UPI000372517D|nr:iron-containing redox enzyme family protein [Noviherbaspirillum massiliense]
MSFFIRLIESTDNSRRELEALPKVQDMLNSRMSRETYQAFLMDLYHIVWHFCPIMAAAASHCPDEFRDVRYHLYNNINEEKGHESLVLNDLAVFGVSAQQVAAAPPTYPVQAMIAYNYHAAERIHPCAALGMLYVLEIISSVYGGQVATSISRGLNMELPDGFTFLESHASMDMDHMAKLRALLQKITDEEVQDIVINAIHMNFYLFIKFLSQ